MTIFPHCLQRRHVANGSDTGRPQDSNAMPSEHPEAQLPPPGRQSTIPPIKVSLLLNLVKIRRQRALQGFMRGEGDEQVRSLELSGEKKVIYGQSEK